MYEIVWLNPLTPGASPELRNGDTWESKDIAQLAAMIQLSAGYYGYGRYRAFRVDAKPEAIEKKPETLKLKRSASG